MYPLLSQERVKLRTSNLAVTLTGSIRTILIIIFWRKVSVGVSGDCPKFLSKLTHYSNDGGVVEERNIFNVCYWLYYMYVRKLYTGYLGYVYSIYSTYYSPLTAFRCSPNEWPWINLNSCFTVTLNSCFPACVNCEIIQPVAYLTQLVCIEA